jgi:hypothetical protein
MKKKEKMIRANTPNNNNNKKVKVKTKDLINLVFSGALYIYFN